MRKCAEAILVVFALEVAHQVLFVLIRDGDGGTLVGGGGTEFSRRGRGAIWRSQLLSELETILS